MSDSHPSPRLAAYGALAAGALAAGTHADVQVYEGLPIPLDTGGGTTTLSLAGVEFDLDDLEVVADEAVVDVVDGHER